MSDHFSEYRGAEPHFDTGEDLAGDIVPAMSRKVPVHVDLVFAIDRTGSSAAFAEGILRAIPMIAGPVKRKAASLRLFLQTHGDLDCRQYPIMMVRDGTVEEVEAAANRIDFDGGGDAPEHHTHALETLLDSVDWSAISPSRRAVVLFTTADTKPSPSGCTPEQVAAKLQAKNVLLFAVCEKEPGMMALVSRAQGEDFEISNDPSDAEMQSIAAAVAASVLASVVDPAPTDAYLVNQRF